jgi:hypothetical protein
MGEDSDSDGFESVVSDGNCDSYHSSQDGSDAEMADEGKADGDDDGFEEVQDKKSRRRR